MAEGWTVPPIWKGQRVFIIAGGSSVPKGYLATHRLAGRVIAIKDAVLLYPHADCMFYADTRFHKERAEIFQAFRGGLTVKRSVHDGIPEHVHQVKRWRPPVKTTDDVLGLCTRPDALGGWDSGGSAINLAFHLGAREIILIGFDLRGMHWNPDHPLPLARMRTHERHRISIDAMAAPLQAHGVAAWNTSPASNLKEYPRAQLADFV